MISGKNDLLALALKLHTYISLMYVHCVSFKNELTNLSYMLSFGVNNTLNISTIVHMYQFIIII